MIVKKRKIFGVGLPGGKPKGVDFDATVLALNEAGQVVRACGVENPDPFPAHSLVHGGDDKGGTEHSAETISAQLANISPAVHGLGVVLASFTGAGLDQVNGTDFTLMANGRPQIEIMLPISERGRNAAVMAVLWRRVDDPTKWEIKKIGQLVSIDPHFDGNRDGVVNWQDMSSQLAEYFARARRS